MRLEIFTDGACSGNPGPAAVGVVIKNEGKTIKEISRSIGNATNNIAEYTAMIDALQEALALKADEVFVKTDSELMYKQIIGKYKVKHDGIKPLFDQVVQLVKGFKRAEFQHVPREQNTEADKLARLGLKTNQDDRPDAKGVREESPSSKG
jgi:ribonuclease HI